MGLVLLGWGLYHRLILCYAVERIASASSTNSHRGVSILMSFVGRIIAGARDLSFGGPLGNLLAGAARLIPSSLPPHGHGEDNGNGDPRRRIAFTIAVIALGAKIAQADGAVTRDEVAAFGEVFQVPPGEEEHVRLVFDLARKSTAGFERLRSDKSVAFLPMIGRSSGTFSAAFFTSPSPTASSPSAEDDYLRERSLGISVLTPPIMPVFGPSTSAPPQVDAAEDPLLELGSPGDLPR